MKKLVLLTLFLIPSAFAWEQNFSGYSTNTVIMERPGKAQNCLTSLTWTALSFPAAGHRMIILDGATTTYSLLITTGTFTQRWDANNPLCTTVNSSMTITTDVANVTRNYTGFIKGR